jgi:subtilase family serine protease
LYSGTPDADIDAPEAWDLLEGSSSITVGVIDSGVDYNNPDLAANYAGGYDFVSMDSDPMDDHGHGTHVAGTIAAALNNRTGTPPAAEGVVGVAPNARIRAYKVCSADGTCSDFAIQQAIAQAITDGVKVINMSLGEAEYSLSLDDAVQEAWNAGLVIVAGAGNNGTTELFYPAALNNVISVGAFDPNHQRASFSNYGSWVDISAPGSIIMSTYPMVSCGSSTTPGDTGCYTWNSGTSMATPHVAGAAALVWSRSDVTSNSQVVDILLNSADPQGVGGVRLDSWTIHGGLNLHDAVSYGLSNLPPDAEAGPDQTVADVNGDGSESVTLDGSASSDSDGTITTYTWREGGATIATGATATVTLSMGAHTLTLEVTDDDGASTTDTVVITVNPSNQVTVTASTAQANEAGPTNGAFTVTRVGGTSVPLTVNYAITGTATTGTDYTPLPGVVTLDAGAATATVVVTPIDDASYESNETVVLTLSANAGYSLGSPAAATVTIVSNDLPPDLIVSAMTAPAIAGPDTDIVVTDSTKNQGTGAAAASKTGFYLSTDTNLDALDTLLGSRVVSALTAGATLAGSTTLHLPPATVTGSYRVLAKADWDGAVNENSETNNVRASGVINVGPDLVVSAVTAPAIAAAGGTITVSDTTKNQGGSNAAATTTRFYWSTNTSIDASDQVLGNRSVPIIAAGVLNTASTTFTVPANAATGTYYIIAQADGAAELAEPVETNNTRSTGAINVGSDLIVTAVTVPASGTPGGTISVTDTTRNQGGGTSPASATGFYLSTNSSFSPDDTFIGSRDVGALAANVSATASTVVQLPLDTPTGSYQVIAVADWNDAVDETVDNNNTRASGTIRVGGDLVLTALAAPANAVANTYITVTDTAKNQGTVAIPGTVTGFYLSLNGSYEPTDTFLGTRNVGALAPSATESGSTQLLIPPGTLPASYNIVAVADMNNAVVESLESNNTRGFGWVRVGPDLLVSVLTAPSSAVAGTSITVGDTTNNQGAEATPASVTSFYLSTNSTLDAADPPLGVRAVAGLGAGLSQAGSVTVQIPANTAPGTYQIIAKSDGDNSILEYNETNNTRTRTITITAPPQP